MDTHLRYLVDLRCTAQELLQQQKSIIPHYLDTIASKDNIIVDWFSWTSYKNYTLVVGNLARHFSASKDCSSLV